MQFNLKLILIIMLPIILLGLLGGYLYIKRPLTDIFFEDPRLREGISKFLNEVYDKEENSFKIDKESKVSLRANFYATIINKMFLEEKMTGRINVGAMFDKIRSHYVSPGYYAEEGEDPVFTTAKALSIDIQYPEDLNQAINLDWLKENSIENNNLEPSKLDPEYQHAVIQIYKLLGLTGKVEELSVPYLNYYCNYNPPENISDKEYLRVRLYQISILHLLANFYRAPESCLNQKAAEATKEKLSKIQFSDLDNLEEVFYLCHLKKFYNLLYNSDVEFGNVFKRIKDFYSGEAFKENLSDQEPNLIGTHYAAKLILQFYAKYILKAPIEI